VSGQDAGAAGLLADPKEVRAILVASARAGQAITYAEVLGLLGHHFTRPKMRALCKVLAFVDDEAEALGEPELAVLVVRQSDGLPGQGWWVGGAKKHGCRAVGRSQGSGADPQGSGSGVRVLEVLPGTGRWRREALTEGSAPRLSAPPPSNLRSMVPLPVPGRIG